MKKCPPAGLRVCFAANPAARALYSGDAPRTGECGAVTTLPMGGRRASCMPGPGGGLVYVDWDQSRTAGVFRNHLHRESTGKPLGSSRRRRRRR